VDEYVGGKLVRHRRIDDTSWVTAGVPTRNTIENYNDIDIGRVQLRKSPIQDPASPDKLVTINYNAPMTIHAAGATDDLQKQLADAHQRHVDALSKIMQEAVYQDNRKSLDQGATAL
jgi:hypothetical protein